MPIFVQNDVLSQVVPDGEDPGHWLADFVNKWGQVGTAHHLGVSQATVSRWLSEFGYVKNINYVKVEESAS